MKKIVIEVNGGSVQTVRCTDENYEIVVVDYDDIEAAGNRNHLMLKAETELNDHRLHLLY